MWYLQHGRSKGWEDSADANNRKRPSFTMGFCYQKNSVSTADPPKQDIGCPLRDFGIIFFHSLSSSLQAWKCGLYFTVTIHANFGGQGRWMCSLPTFHKPAHLTHQFSHRALGRVKGLDLLAATAKAKESLLHVEVLLFSLKPDFLK